MLCSSSVRFFVLATWIASLAVVSSFVVPKTSIWSTQQQQQQQHGLQHQQVREENGNTVLVLKSSYKPSEFSVWEEDEDGDNNDEVEEEEEDVVLSSSSTASDPKSEYSVSGDDGDGNEEFYYEDDDDEEEEDEFFSSSSFNNESQDDMNNYRNFEYAAMLPGTSVQICVGDIGLARKAWKKRRRSGSPLLVPCSVLNVDRTNMIRWNILYLLEKFGHSQKYGIALSLEEISKRHTQHLKSSLEEHGMALGYDDPRDLVESLFDKKEQNTYGVQLWTEEEELWMKAPISRFRAQKKASKAALLQVHNVDDDDDTMKHTGFVRIKNNLKERSATTELSSFGAEEDINAEEQPRKLYRFPALSAALRVSQRDDLDTGRITNGSMRSAVLFDYDINGDGGSPLLTLSLTPSRAADHQKQTVRNSRALKIANTNNKAGLYNKYQPIQDPKGGTLDDIKIGDGPLSAKVVRLFRDKALVDCQIGRKLNVADSSSSDQDVGIPDMVKVFGSLYFKDVSPVSSDGSEQQPKSSSRSKEKKDAKENDEEDDDFNEIMKNVVEKIDLEDGEEVDITHLFNLDDDGSLTYDDPESGKQTALISGDDIDAMDDDDDDEEEDEDEEVVEQEEAMSSATTTTTATTRTRRLYVGDQIDVYIKSVSKQSSQYTLTMNPSQVQGKTAKSFKREQEVQKKLQRLENMIPGGLKKIEELAGTEYTGTIKATSQTGDWYYVQPENNDDEDFQLPVGVATMDNDSTATATTTEEIGKGDVVRIELRGIDEERGQLSMRVIEKLAP